MSHPLFEIPDLPGRALCAETDPEAFFPENGHNGRDARALCGHCEVRDACLQWALATGERYGIWGGLNVKERRALQVRARSAHPDAA